MKRSQIFVNLRSYFGLECRLWTYGEQEKGLA
jgi:hypothetical protein